MKGIFLGKAASLTTQSQRQCLHLVFYKGVHQQVESEEAEPTEPNLVRELLKGLEAPLTDEGNDLVAEGEDAFKTVG